MYQQVKAIKATVLTKHLAVITCASGAYITDFNKTRSVTRFKKHTPAQMSNFFSDSLNLDWSNVFESDDLQRSFDVFYNNVNCILNLYFPLSTVTLTSRDSP